MRRDKSAFITKMAHKNHVLAHRSAQNGRTEMYRTILESGDDNGSSDTTLDPFLKVDLPRRSTRRSRRSPKNPP